MEPYCLPDLPTLSLEYDPQRHQFQIRCWPITNRVLLGLRDQGPYRSQSELRPHYPNQFRHYPFTITYIPIANFTCLGRSFDRFLYVLPLDSSIYISPSVSICHRSYLVPCT